jgi:hypothetical protein
MLMLRFALVALATSCPTQACDAKIGIVWGQRDGQNQLRNRLREGVATPVCRPSLMGVQNISSIPAMASRDGGACLGALPANAVGCCQSRAG